MRKKNIFRDIFPKDLKYKATPSLAKLHLQFPQIKDIDRQKRLQLGLPVEKLGTLPFGYKEVEGSKILEPIDEEITLLVKARQHLEYAPLKEVAIWLSRASGRKVKEETLRKIMVRRPPFEEAALPRAERERLYYNPHPIDYHSYSVMEERLKPKTPK